LHPVGCYEIELVLQKINKPAWTLDDAPELLPESEPLPSEGVASQHSGGAAGGLAAFPALQTKHLHDAALFADRYDLVRSLTSLRHGTIAEVGVARGDFSEFLIDTLEPRLFVGFDLFQMHEYPEHWGTPSSVLFEGKTQLDFYHDRFRDRGSKIATEVGLGHVQLLKYPDEFFDLIYIDANHFYDAVKQDAQSATQKLKKTGILIFNDYTMFDPLANVAYGVVQAVNEMVVNDGWCVIGFALERLMFCDIAIRRNVDIT
jgi:hypothetical protein